MEKLLAWKDNHPDARRVRRKRTIYPGWLCPVFKWV